MGEKDISLKEYLCTFVSEDDISLAETSNSSLSYVINGVFFKRSLEQDVPSLGPATNYIDFIDRVILHIKMRKLDNVLVNGYYCTQLRGINEFASFVVNFLKSQPWEFIYGWLGQMRLLSLILNSSASLMTPLGVAVQLWGPRDKFNPSGSAFISNARMLCRDSNSSGNPASFKLLPLDTEVRFLLEVIMDRPIKSKNIPKKFRKLNKILHKVHEHSRRVNMAHIFKHIVSSKSPSSTIWEAETNLKRVVNFVLTVLSKLLPLEVWGTVSNKKIVFKNISTFLQSGPSRKFSLNCLCHSISLNNIHWLGRDSVTRSIQEFKQKTSIFLNFLRWIFSSLIPQLVTKMWYVSELPRQNKNSLMFIPHAVWRNYKKEWLSNYCQRYLIKFEFDCLPQKLSTVQKFNFGSLKLIPKSNDLRLLCVPYKTPIDLVLSGAARDRDQNNRQHWKYLKDIINPTRQILLHKLRKYEAANPFSYPHCYSIADIVLNIKKFKAALIDLYKYMPRLYLLKFDMKNCYDSLSQEKILQYVSQLFNHEDSGKTYYTRDFSVIKKLKVSKIKTLTKDQSNFTDFFWNYYNLKSFGSSIEDRSKTIKLSKKEILDVVQEHVKNTAIVTGPIQIHTYRRTHGVFQGFPLSATFCDIVYRNMVEEKFGYLKDHYPNTLVLRLADDFLVLTDNLDSSKKVSEMIQDSSLHPYGAYTNTEKTVSISECSDAAVISFVGLSINTTNLEISRTYPSINLDLAESSSFKRIYSQLQTIYKMRLEVYLLDCSFQSLTTLLENIHTLLKCILQYLLQAYKTLRSKHDYCRDTFQIFVLQMLDITIQKFVTANDTLFQIDDVISVFWTTFQVYLSDDTAEEMRDAIIELYN